MEALSFLFNELTSYFNYGCKNECEVTAAVLNDKPQCQVRCRKLIAEATVTDDI